MDFKVTPNYKNQTFAIIKEGKVYLTGKISNELFEYLLYSTLNDWKEYLKRKPLTLTTYL
jgi:hypothetical protein